MVSHYVALADLELAMLTRLAFNWWRSASRVLGSKVCTSLARLHAEGFKLGGQALHSREEEVLHRCLQNCWKTGGAGSRPGLLEQA